MSTGALYARGVWHLERADSCRAAGAAPARCAHEYQSAIDYFTQAIDSDPDSAVLYSNRCLCYCRIDEYQRGLEDCSRAIELEPESPAPYSNRAVCNLGAGNPRRACGDWAKACSSGDPRACDSQQKNCPLD